MSKILSKNKAGPLRLIVSIFAFIIALSALGACGSNSAGGGLVGSWSNRIDGWENTWTFESGGAFETAGRSLRDDREEASSGIWEITNNVLRLTIEGEEFTAEFEIDGDVLRLDILGEGRFTLHRVR